MKKTIYMDHSATTYVDERVKAVMEPYFCELYGNPSSMHHKGQEAKEALVNARNKVASLLSAFPEEIIFYRIDLWDSLVIFLNSDFLDYSQSIV